MLQVITSTMFKNASDPGSFDRTGSLAKGDIDEAFSVLSFQGEAETASPKDHSSLQATRSNSGKVPKVEGKNCLSRAC